MRYVVKDKSHTYKVLDSNHRFWFMENNDLPYWELDYIESTGTQWIDTGYYPTVDTRAEVDFNVVSLSGSYASLCASRVNANNSAFSQGLYSNGIYMGFGTNSENTTIYTKLTTGLRYLWVQDKTSVRLSSITDTRTLNYNGTKSNSFSTHLNLYLFARNNNGTVGNYSLVKMYSCKIYDGNTLVRNFIPCIRKIDNAVCMYDRVSKQFFLNSGTGTFIAGPYVLPKGYRECEYLESTGTQWIDTGYALKTDIVKLDIQFMNTQNNNGKNLCSSSANNAKSFGLYQSTNTSMTPYNGSPMVASAITATGKITKASIETLGIGKNSTAIIDGTSQTRSQTATIVSNVNFGLFTKNDSNTSYITQRFVSARVYYFKLWDNDVLVRDFIPCLDNKGVPCMFDKVNNTTYYNKGTGVFKYAMKGE